MLLVYICTNTQTHTHTHTHIYIYIYIFKSNWGPHSHVLVPYMFSDESNKLETYTNVRTK